MRCLPLINKISVRRIHHHEEDHSAFPGHRCCGDYHLCRYLAAYDTLSANNTGEGALLDFGAPVTVEMNLDAGEANSRELDQAPSVTTTATVNVANEDGLGEKITLTFDMAGTDGAPLVETTDYTLDVKANSSYVDGSSTITPGTTDVTFEGTNVAEGEKTYDVTVTLTEEGARKIAEKNGAAEVKLEMTATLS